mmetsp:Transcript_54063/g.143927  ORF Transcript_54063/g.143927 Transcript_54063/m.143927 type:complete len:589 (+) Transcript_54063:412-2178(+)
MLSAHVDHSHSWKRTSGVCSLEYLNQSQLQEFLFNRQKVNNGILQQFLDPKGNHNAILRALWSPQVTVLERRINRNRLFDTKMDIYERAITFEGPDFHSVPAPVRGSKLPAAIHQMASGIASHATAVSGDKLRISRMALNLKMDVEGNPWLLWASSIRLQDELKAQEFSGSGAAGPSTLHNTPLESESILTIPAHVRVGQSAAAMRPVTLQQPDFCPICTSPVHHTQLHPMYYHILQEWEQKARIAIRKGVQFKKLPGVEGLNNGHPLWDRLTQVSAAAEQDMSKAVPRLINHLHPRLTQAEYLQWRDDPVFHFKAVPVCQDCYCVFSALTSAVVKLKELEPTAADLKGTGPTNPARTKAVREATAKRLKARREEEAHESSERHHGCMEPGDLASPQLSSLPPEEEPSTMIAEPVGPMTVAQHLRKWLGQLRTTNEFDVSAIGGDGPVPQVPMVELLAAEASDYKAATAEAMRATPFSRESRATTASGLSRPVSAATLSRPCTATTTAGSRPISAVYCGGRVPSSDVSTAATENTMTRVRSSPALSRGLGKPAAKPVRQRRSLKHQRLGQPVSEPKISTLQPVLSRLP